MPPQPTQQSSFLEKYSLITSLMQFPALTVMVCLRRDIGYRLLNPLQLIVVFGLLFVLAILAMPGNEAARPIDLAIFAGIAFVNGLCQRVRRWIQLARGHNHLSYYVGSSPFDFRWLPDFARRNRRVARFVDPIFCAAVGLMLFPFSRALGMWLVFSGLCLRAYEDQIFRRERNRDLDIIDSLIISEHQSETLEQFEQSQAPAQFQPDAGIPTGLGDDVQTQINQRKSSRPPSKQ
jgi:hypothetical protein